MNCKTAILILIFGLGLNSVKAQEFCDSTFIICDSITLDSVVFTDFPDTGNRIHLSLTTNHDFLHGPTFIMCPENDSIELVDDKYPFFGLIGPATINTFYEFLNFNIVGDTLEGYIIVDNTNNPFQNCAILFKIPVIEETTNTNNNWLQNGIEIFPNPANKYLTINLNDNTLTEVNIQLFDLMGRKQRITYSPPKVDLSNIATGVYLLHLEINNIGRLIKKVVIK